MTKIYKEKIDKTSKRPHNYGVLLLFPYTNMDFYTYRPNKKMDFYTGDLNTKWIFAYKDLTKNYAFIITKLIKSAKNLDNNRVLDYFNSTEMGFYTGDLNTKWIFTHAEHEEMDFYTCRALNIN